MRRILTGEGEGIKVSPSCYIDVSALKEYVRPLAQTVMHMYQPGGRVFV